MSQEAGHGDCTPLCTSAMPRALVAWSLSRVSCAGLLSEGGMVDVRGARV